MIQYDNRQGFKLLFALRGSITRSVAPQVALCTLLACLVVGLSTKYIKITVSPTPWVIVGGALGLLLVFRTNTAYDRYWEGRKLFGGLTSATRSLATTFLSSFHDNGNNHLEMKIKFIHLLIAFPKLAKQALRDERNIPELDELLYYLTEKEKEELILSENPSLTLMLILKGVLYDCVQHGYITDFQVVSMEEKLDSMLISLGGCERIRKTPIPFAYVVHLKGLLGVFCTTLPLGLIEGMGWASVFATLFVSFAFLGIEEIGVEIEDPFGEDPNDLPLDDICNGIERNLLYVLEQANRLASEVEETIKAI
ncbi:bestrophin family ion channel [Aneurinibacillus sp. Ricciae_BoGa-3]|uniref:bestrophin family protein n=1 Tax=Aneurinibacillus sp. Ricciae_BoGa-3 TaxID=3022697 RepID=UPI002342485A|nr:bestrophin family ion channel [Aneurinibacillus sp. Ricciae_BoGa-3]WCK52821.1 bestrophin family ion channel [Aneurinibacillus sp. Ricciae_BoGa-3]